MAILATLWVGVARPGHAHGGRASPPLGVVEPRFEPDARDARPFPSDLLTVPDRLQRTGVRVNLPLPNCAVERSACDDVRLLNELDGFDVEPRLAVSFTGPIDLASVTPRSVFLVRLAAGPPEATGLDRLVWDPQTHTLYARPETLLEQETRYGLVVTRDVKDVAGRPIRSARPFQRFLEDRGGSRGYRAAFAALFQALGRRGVRADHVAVAAVFTTGSLSTFLEQARDALERRRPAVALMTAPEGGGRAYFTRASLERLVFRRHVAAGGDGAFRDQALPLAALPRDAVGGVGIGWYWSPWYLGPERRIAEGPTQGPLLPASMDIPVPFVVVLPAGPPPETGWPLAIFGHGYGGEMLSSALLVAGTLAQHGIATVAITVVGHGGGPDSRLLVGRADGRTATVLVPGRGIDLDGDGRLGAAEGLSPRPGTPLATLSLRDGLRQQVVDLMALIRAVVPGLDVDGDGVPDTGRGPIFYAGQSLGGIYGTLLLAVDPRVRTGVLNVPGGPIAEVARLSPVFRPLVRDTLARRVPPLASPEGDFREDLPLRGQPPVVGPAPGALAIQDYLARATWLSRRADPVAYARHLRAAPLQGLEPARVLIQFATGDRVVPNPTTSAMLRAGALSDAASLLRYDRLAPVVPRDFADPHGFLLRVLGPGSVGALARASQEQVARFFLEQEGGAWNPDDGPSPPFTERVFELAPATLPDGLGFEPDDKAPRRDGS